MGWKYKAFWKHWLPRSLALRLAIWYAASAFLLLLSGTGFLYWKLVQNSNAEDDQYMSEKAHTLQKLLAARDFRTLKWEVEDASAVRPAVELLSRVISSDGSVLFETMGMSQVLPPSTFPANGRIEYRTVHHRPLHKRAFRVLSMQSPGYLLQVGLEVTSERKLLAEYRERMTVVLIAGLLLSAAMGYAIARRGTRPVEEMAATVRRIRSSTLDRRVDTGGLPSELALLAYTFNETLDGLEEAFARLSRFSSDIAHELRTPVNNIRGEAEVALSKTRTAQEYRETIESSLEEGLRLSRIIESLLFLARAEHPEAQIRHEPVDIGCELLAVREFYEAAAGEAGVSLELEASQGLAGQLDRTLFQRAIGNLIENSLAHTQSGGHIRIEAARASGTLLVAVADDGCGIPPEHLSHVFDRFYRVDAARSHRAGGVGLGLAIVRSVARLHGGDARIDSAVDGGTRVTLHFPERHMTKS